MPSSTDFAVLLDIDGTLLDSNDAHAHAWLDAFAHHGRPQRYERVRPMIGMGGDKLLGALFGLSDKTPPGKTLADERKHRFQQHLPSLQPTPGARLLLKRLRNDGWTMVIATSSGEDEVQGLLRQAGVDDLVGLVTSSSDVAHSKPDPDIVEAALRKSGVPAARAVMIGDTPYDIEAARRAGVDTIALRCGGGWTDADLAGAIAIYDDPADLLAQWHDSPLAAVCCKTC